MIWPRWTTCVLTLILPCHVWDLTVACFSLQAAPIAPGNAPPHKILFVQNLPAETTAAMLALLFQQYGGYVETRMVEARPGIAFVEFEDEDKATVAMAGLQGFKITATNALTISYANR